MAGEIPGELAVLRRAYQCLLTQEEIVVSLGGTETTYTSKADVKVEIDARLRRLEAEIAKPGLVTDG